MFVVLLVDCEFEVFIRIDKYEFVCMSTIDASIVVVVVVVNVLLL
jgi:hypothetical protein